MNKILKIGFERKLPILLLGRPGVGKSQRVFQVAKELEKEGKKVDVIDIRLVNYDTTDFYVIIPDPVNKRAVGVPGPAIERILEASKRNDLVVVFLDEIDKANPYVQKLAYQLILDRRVENIKIPDNVAFVAAANFEEDSVASTPIEQEKPLFDRFVFRIRVDPNTDEWINWAIANEIDNRIIAYLAYNKDKLYVENDNLLVATPRRWKFLSDVIKGVDTNEIEDLVNAVFYDKSLSTHFVAFVKLVEDMNPDKMLESGRVPEELEKQYALVPYFVDKIFECAEKKDKKLEKKLEVVKKLSPDVIALIAKIIHEQWNKRQVFGITNLMIKLGMIDKLGSTIDKFAKFE